MFYRNLIRFMYDGFRIFFHNKQACLYFLFHNCKLYKPLFVSDIRYILLKGRVVILKGTRIEFYKVSTTYDPLLSIGNKVLIGYNCSFLVSGKLTIGNDCMIASNVLITTENHGIDLTKGNYINQPLNSKDVIIGNNVWIGEKCVILPGVTIGDNCVIGASSVVTKNVPKDCIACGNPAKVIKYFNYEKKEWVSINECKK